PGTPGAAGPGAKLLVTEPVASASNEYVQLGKAGPFTLYTRCRISGGTVDAYLVLTGPPLTSDATYVSSSDSSATVSISESGFKISPTIASPRIIGNASANAGGHFQTVGTSTLLQSDSSVAVQSWV